MHIVKTTQNVILPDQYFLYSKYVYLLDDVNIPLFTQHADNHAQIHHWENPKPFDSSKNWDDKKILIIRAGGYGDILFLTPVIRELKRRWSCKISLCTRPSYMAIAENNQNIESCLEYPCRYDEALKFDAIVALENLLEYKESQQKHAIDLALERMGLETEKKTLDFKLTDKEIAWAAKEYPRSDKKRLAIQATCTSPMRSYPTPHLSIVVDSIAKNNMEVFLIGEPMSITMRCTPDVAPFVTNLSLKCFTYRESLAVCKTCDAFFGVDSGLTYGCSAIGLPCIAVYGAYPSKLRAAYEPNIKVLEKSFPCAPCFAKTGFPSPHCYQSKRCEAIAAVMPQEVIAIILEVLK